jgi:hypothetical protein
MAVDQAIASIIAAIIGAAASIVVALVTTRERVDVKRAPQDLLNNNLTSERLASTIASPKIPMSRAKLLAARLLLLIVYIVAIYLLVMAVYIPFILIKSNNADDHASRAAFIGIGLIPAIFSVMFFKIGRSFGKRIRSS